MIQTYINNRHLSLREKILIHDAMQYCEFRYRMKNVRKGLFSFVGYRPGIRTSIRKIIKIVCNVQEVPEYFVSLKSRKKKIVETRQLCHYFARRMTKLTHSFIGEILGDVGHDTVIYGIRTVQDYIDTDKEFRCKAETIARQLNIKL